MLALIKSIKALFTSRRAIVALACVAAFALFVPNVIFAEVIEACAIVVGAWIISDGIRSTGTKALLIAMILSSSSLAMSGTDICRAATVRVRNGTIVGSGTVFRETPDAIYVLTNAHVTGVQLNRQVLCEFWRRGHQSRPVPGTTVAIAYRQGAYRDVAVVRVALTSLGAYRPPIIPLAADQTAADYSYVFSVGCAAGRWPSAIEGFGLSVGDQQGKGDVVRFVPAPAGGRSGSALFDVRGWPQIIGLIAWRSSDAGGHNLDGFGESSAHGIAMTHREVWSALRGETQTAIRSAPQFALPPDAIPVQANVPQRATGRPASRPQTQSKDQGQDAPATPIPEPQTGDASDAVLLYSDPAAVAGDSYPITIQAYGSGSNCPQGQCPPGGCPPGYQAPPGYQQPPGDQLFPSWRERWESGQPAPPSQQPLWLRFAPWVGQVAAVLVVLWLASKVERLHAAASPAKSPDK